MYRFPHPMANPRTGERARIPCHARTHWGRRGVIQASIAVHAPSLQRWQSTTETQRSLGVHTPRSTLVGEWIQTIVENYPLYPVIEALWLNQYEEDDNGGENNQGKSWSDLPAPARKC